MGISVWPVPFVAVMQSCVMCSRRAPNAGCAWRAAASGSTILHPLRYGGLSQPGEPSWVCVGTLQLVGLLLRGGTRQ